MKIVVALGGRALLKRGELMSAANQISNLEHVAATIKDAAIRHQLIVTHGNVSQLGWLSLQSEALAKEVPVLPFDALSAQTQGMLGYWLMQALKNVLPHRAIASLVTQVGVSLNDPAFKHPTHCFGPVWDEVCAKRLMAERGWTMMFDGRYWRRVLPAPRPVQIVEIDAIRTLVEAGVLVIAGGGGGIPVVVDDGHLQGIDALIEKDETASLLALSLKAKRLVLATDIDGVYEGWLDVEPRRITRAHPFALMAMDFPTESMGAKVKAACDFVMNTGHEAVIGSLDDLDVLVEGQSGTVVTLDCEETEYEL
ncbi:MAG: carbamate kinase [Burkholderiaceae bacterium]|nr:carbamate kinase [Burkholderiaceae bacterium]